MSTLVLVRTGGPRLLRFASGCRHAVLGGSVVSATSANLPRTSVRGEGENFFVYGTGGIGGCMDEHGRREVTIVFVFVVRRKQNGPDKGVWEG